MKLGDVVVYKSDEEVCVGVLLSDGDTVVYGDALDQLSGKEIIKVYEGVPELVSAYKIVEANLNEK